MLTNGLNPTQTNSAQLNTASHWEQLQKPHQLSDTIAISSFKSSCYASTAAATPHLSTVLPSSDRGSASGQVGSQLTQQPTSPLPSDLPLSPSLASGTYSVTVQPSLLMTAIAGTAQTLNPSPATPGDWFSQTFDDTGIANLTRSLYANDGGLNRNDVISIFREVEQDNIVSGYEISDLHTLVADGNLLNMPNYVQVLSAKVIGDNPANISFQGDYLGDLHAGSSGGQLEALVDKWFFGSDHPATYIPATSSSAARYIDYGWANGSLFGTDGTFDLSDIQQGHLGDCYFLASLGATALQNPSAIQNMFIDNGDGTFTVRLFAEHDGIAAQTPDYVTVDRYLPDSVYDYGSGSWNNRFADYDNQSVGIWVALAEKAYAQFAEEGVSQRNNNNPDGSGTGYVPNSYGSIEGGWGFRTMPALTGSPAGYFAEMPDTQVNPNSYLGSLPSLQTIAAALDQGYALTADTLGTSDSTTDPYTGIVMNHEYVVADVDLSSGNVLLYNPWGDNNLSTGDYYGYKVISYNDLLSDLAGINIS